MALNLGGGSMTSNFNSLYLRNAQSMLNQSLMRLSSGKRINRPSDDPGGLAVSMKLQNALTVTSATKQNIDNAKSYIDTQDAALSSVGDILNRMSTIKELYGEMMVLVLIQQTKPIMLLSLGSCRHSLTLSQRREV